MQVTKGPQPTEERQQTTNKSRCFCAWQEKFVTYDYINTMTYNDMSVILFGKVRMVQEKNFIVMATACKRSNRII